MVLKKLKNYYGTHFYVYYQAFDLRVNSEIAHSGQQQHNTTDTSSQVAGGSSTEAVSTPQHSSQTPDSQPTVVCGP